MQDSAIEDWQDGELVVVPLAWRNDGLWSEIQATTQGSIGANLRTMYGELLQQPLSPLLDDVAREIERRLTAS
ncbi:carbon monoxide dehydrogenase subunit G [Microvirga lupini]|uniref:Carbon monoxide dehydrogenase subunit G n=1 Tax=Microvirga lupini TaxID=420324 RepID=A0A7W4VKE4_9HYPH|nr:hypothetical protein [Microvirga lupini]MBB3018819.1 carbon monoxide dehydrogenase subunit G [Microvirga lupini]